MNGMTGYSFKEIFQDDAYITTEIKTVNSRFLDININMPNYLNFMEINIKDLIRKNLIRGKIEIFVNLKINENVYDISANVELSKQYYNNLNEIIKALQLKDEVRLFHLTKYDDVIHVERKKDYEKYWGHVEKSLNDNITEILNMRKKEGDDIKKDLTQISSNIKSNVETIADKVPVMEKEIYDNMKEKITDLLGDKVDEVKLLNEAAVMVNRSCINEEIQRLRSHIEHFITVMGEDKDIGKRLDFLCQEMHREINTIGSKVTLVELTGNVISVKNDIEKMREQIRNIE